MELNVCSNISLSVKLSNILLRYMLCFLKHINAAAVLSVKICYRTSFPAIEAINRILP